MTRVDASELLNMKVRTRDGMMIGRITKLEADVATFRITGLRCEASRDLLERLSLAEPSITGGRTVYINTSDVDRVEDEVHLKVDALDLAKLDYRRLSSIP